MFSNKKYQNGKSFVTFFEDTIRVFKPRPPSIFLAEKLILKTLQSK